MVEQELGAPPEKLFVEWDPEPDRGRVDRPGPPRALVGPGRAAERAVAVKVQYPGVADAIRADLANADLLGSLMTQLFRGLDPAPMVAEIQARIGEELDYGLEARQPAGLRRLLRRPSVHPRPCRSSARCRPRGC